MNEKDLHQAEPVEVPQVDDMEIKDRHKKADTYETETHEFGINGKKPYKVKRFQYLKGSITGFLAGILALSLVIAGFIGNGYIHIGSNGEIYVQDISIDDSNAGISEQITDKLDTIEQLLDGSFYFDVPDKAAAAENVYKAYVDSYDDIYTVYYTPDEYTKITQETTGKYYGIGVVVSKNSDGTIKVVLPYENCPGWEAGIKIGDIITKVNGTSVVNRDLTAVVADIKGAAGTTVEIELMREGLTEPMVLKVERREIEVPTVSSKMLDGNIGYIAVTQFDEVTVNQFDEAYNQLKNQGMQGLVIDIRSNPGGLLSSVVKMLDKILPNGLIVYTEDKSGKRTEYKGTNNQQIDVPLSVLVNGDSASASEIFAGAVQDYGVGTIVGTTTFGKGIVQTIRPLTDGSAVKFTIAKYFTPKGQDIHKKGVTPDVTVEINEAVKNKTSLTQEEDNQLQKAIELVKSKINK